ncbi:hypothetical protein [Arthrobacter antioxidans]|uniref:hypothetical protein n=1 Tax=Arthrobacter antioxidans TaxID=2895818 RepID=UPI001FFF3290|nr:hypothetical protein [Arthrobacter antioxidans]
MQSEVVVDPVGGRERRRLLRRWGSALGLWLVAATVLSASGVLAAMVEVAPTMVIPAFVTVGMLAPLLAVARSTQLQALFLSAPLPYLTVFNVWRVPAALVFFAYGAAGLLPASFAMIAGIGDLIAGVLAVGVVLLAPRLSARAGRRAYLAFHVFSFSDFVTAVGTGITLTLLGDPLMASLADFPLALIPLFGVPVTGVLSLIALWRLAPTGFRGR